MAPKNVVVEGLKRKPSSRKNAVTTENALRSQIPVSESFASSAYQSRSVTSRQSAATTSPTSEVVESSAHIGPGDKKFRDQILVPRGIIIAEKITPTNPYLHFEKDPPKPSYKEIGFDSTVFVNLTATLEKKIHKEYKAMSDEGMVEAEFVQCAHKLLLLNEEREIDVPKKVVIKVDRMVELGLKPLSREFTKLWEAPDIIDALAVCTKHYNFDIRADVIYWLSLSCFNDKYRDAIMNRIFVHNKRRLAPYFTVEFKRHIEAAFKARNQVAIAAVLALYNRCLLKIERLKRTRKMWTAKHTGSLRHYGLTLEGSEYYVWGIFLKPEPNDASVCPHAWKWPGCSMVCLAHGDLLQTDGPLRLVEWINEIHRYGMGAHLKMVRKDLKMLIELDETDTRTSLGGDQDSDDEEDKCGCEDPPSLPRLFNS